MGRDRKYIFVTGGVLSGVGKGITAASIGAILKARGIKVSIQKCDPYLNVDAGTLNPAEHGECFVTCDGAETDLDLGHYERFLDIELHKDSAMLAGRLLLDLINDERAGKYLGKTVQVIPHLTEAIQHTIETSSPGSDVHIVELGGTVGDFESVAFTEAMREFMVRAGRQNCLFVHVVYIPYLSASKELKTKPAQNSIRDLRAYGIMPDMIVARANSPINNGLMDKLSLFGGVPKEAVVALPNADTVYRVPLMLEEAGAGNMLMKQLDLSPAQPHMDSWQQIVDKATKPYQKMVKIGVVAKYLDNEDTYFSVIEALRSAAWNEAVNLEYEWVNAEELSEKTAKSLEKFDGLLIPGGFGTRGVKGKIVAADYALEHKIPYLGICLGLQAAVVAAAKRGGVENATSAELDQKSKNQVVYIMDDQIGKESTGGTMRLGDYEAKLAKGSQVAKLYGATEVTERHRHRYEVNRAFENAINKGGLVVSGQSADGRLVEFIEGKNHPYFVATQAHPEFRSRPNRPHPLFTGLIKAAKQ